jgi:hypothetical protein
MLLEKCAIASQFDSTANVGRRRIFERQENGILKLQLTRRTLLFAHEIALPGKMALMDVA